MDDIRSKQRKPDDPRYIRIVFPDGTGKFVNIGKSDRSLAAGSIDVLG